jgi:hypothetical protein
VKEEIEKKAKTEEQERFRRFCQNANIEIAGVQDIEGLVLRDIRRHKTFDESLNIVVAHFLDHASKAMIEEYAKNKKAPPSERANFKKRLRTRHLSKVKDDIRTRARKLLKPKLEQVRNAIADAQLQQFFPVLAHKSWVLTGDNEIIIKRIKVDQNLSTHAFADYMRQPLKASITTKPFKKNELLIETEQKVVEKANLLIEEAKKAWNGQLNIYLAHEQYIEDAAHNRKISIADTIQNHPADADKNWVEHFTGIIEKIWTDNRVYLIWPQGNKPASWEKKYVELFGYIRKAIEQQLKTDIGNIKIKIKAEEAKEAARRKKAKEDAEKEHLKAEAAKKERLKAEAAEKERLKAEATEKEAQQINNGQGSGGTGQKSGGTGQGSGATGQGSGGTGQGNGGAEHGSWWWVKLLSLLKFLLLVLIFALILAVLMYLLGSKYPPDSPKNIFIFLLWLFFIMAIIAGFYQWWVIQSFMNIDLQGKDGNEYTYNTEKYTIIVVPKEGVPPPPQKIQIKIEEK